MLHFWTCRLHSPAAWKALTKMFTGVEFSYHWSWYFMSMHCESNTVFTFYVKTYTYIIMLITCVLTFLIKGLCFSGLWFLLYCICLNPHNRVHDDSVMNALWTWMVNVRGDIMWAAAGHMICGMTHEVTISSQCISMLSGIPHFRTTDMQHLSCL